MKFNHIFLDFDGTLFNHLDLRQWTDEFLSKRFNVAKGTFKGSVDAHYKYFPEGLRLYQHEKHYQNVTAHSWSYMSGEIQRTLRQENIDFCYRDAHAAIETLLKQHTDVRILTCGHGDYQRFKLGTCAFLREANVPIHVVREPKRLFIKQELPKSSGVLVDDKYPLKLPHTWFHVWIDRSSKLKGVQRVSGNEIKISSLDKLSSAIRSL